MKEYCEECGKPTEEIIKFKDELKKVHEVCPKCYESNWVDGFYRKH